MGDLTQVRGVNKSGGESNKGEGGGESNKGEGRLTKLGAGGG